MLQQGVNELLRTGGDYERQGSLSCSLMPYCTASGSLSAIYCLFFSFVLDIMRCGNMGQFVVVVVSPLDYSFQVSYKNMLECVCNAGDLDDQAKETVNHG